MNVYRDFNEIQRDENTVLTVGSFDGIHKGHQKIIKRLKEIAQKENLRAIIITFDPHPQITLQSKNKPPISILTNINEKVKIFRQYGINHCLVVTFSYEFSQTPAEVFIKELLYKKVGIKKILIGYDHMFGKNRSGDKSLLDDLADELNFEVERIDALETGDVIISSTKIRKALEEGEIEKANEMLGHDYMLQGTVVKGDQRGKKLGFPTANIVPPDRHKLIPGNGVYLVSSEIDNKTVYGLANIGLRPTFKNDITPTIEVNFLDFEGDLYDSDLYISFKSYIRPEKKFNSPEELIEQINLDKIKALEMINNF